MAERRSWLNRNVLAIGLTSLFTDASSEMVIPLLPLFLVTVLHAGATTVGGIEGAADALSSLLKLWSGRRSDRSGHPRRYVLAGYALSTIARPLVSLATSPWQVLLVRLSDRTGKGIRSSPRDAILAASVEPENRGVAFGFHRAMDHTGAVVGPLLALLALWMWPGDLRRVFAFAAIPGLFAVLAVALGIDERPAAPKKGTVPSFDRPPDALLRFLVPLGLFALGNASDVFLLLKAGGEPGATASTLPLLWIAFHVVKATVSMIGGKLSDRWDRRLVIGLGWLTYAIVYVLFAFAHTPTQIAVVFVVYGTYHGLTEGTELALVTDLVEPEQRGTAYGWYYATIGLLALPASLLFGTIWELASPTAAFLAGAGLAAAALVTLIVASPRPRAA